MSGTAAVVLADVALDLVDYYLKERGAAQLTPEERAAAADKMIADSIALTDKDVGEWRAGLEEGSNV